MFQRCEGDGARTAFEQSATPSAFLLSDRLADASSGQVQPLGGPAKVKFFGRGEEHFDDRSSTTAPVDHFRL
jgi:hypothetical protein